jgi:hypothetical protein
VAVPSGKNYIRLTDDPESPRNGVQRALGSAAHHLRRLPGVAKLPLDKLQPALSSGVFTLGALVVGAFLGKKL